MAIDRAEILVVEPRVVLEGHHRHVDGPPRGGVLGGVAPRAAHGAGAAGGGEEELVDGEAGEDGGEHVVGQRRPVRLHWMIDGG